MVTKDLLSRGGVANYFRLFFQVYKDETLSLIHCRIGSRPRDYCRRTRRKLSYIREFLSDLLRIRTLLKQDPSIKIVQLNPSLIPVPLVRDGLILLLAFLMNRRIIVFFRGWSDDGVRAVCRHPFLKTLFKETYSLSDCVIVLAQRFVNQLTQLGIPRDKIRVSRTMFDGARIPLLDKRTSPNVRFLYLGRLSSHKGCFEILEAACILSNEGHKFQIDMYGHGADSSIVNQLERRLKELALNEICQIHDYVEGDQRYPIYSRADVFLLPSYQEGCPNSVLEAMACGLFVICTGVGALEEVVQNDINGKIVRVKDPEDLAGKMKWAIQNPAQVRELGAQNRGYAFHHFESEKIISQMTGIYAQVLAQNDR